MASETLKDIKKNEYKKDIQFYINHLDERELKILESIVHQLASEYSTSYKKWKLKPF